MIPLAQDTYFPFILPYEESNSHFAYNSPFPSEPALHPGKRLKLETEFNSIYPQSLDIWSDSVQESMQRKGQLQTPISALSVPHINFFRASEPVSPVTVATTLSQHSSPSPSPSQARILSDNSPHPDWSAYDDTMGAPRVRNLYDDSNNYSHTRYTPSPLPPAMESPYQNASFYPQYPSGQAVDIDYQKIADYRDIPDSSFLRPCPQSYRDLSHPQRMQNLNDDEPPPLSPSSRRPGRPAMSEGEYRSPITPISSPSSENGNRTKSVRAPALREQTCTPKPSMTVSDALEDAPYMGPGSLEQAHQQQSMRNQPQGLDQASVPQFFQVAQNQHKMAQSLTIPSSKRDQSPFRANSAFHPVKSPLHAGPFMTASPQRDQQKEMEKQALLIHLKEEFRSGAMTPQTISPKDAMLEYPEPSDEATSMSMFTDGSASGSNVHTSVPMSVPSSYHGSDIGDEVDYDPTSRRGSEANPIPNADPFRYPRAPDTLQQYINALNKTHMPQNPPIQTNSYSSTTPQTSGTIRQSGHPNIPKSVGSRADTGAYSCTFLGCPQRFPTSSKMMKHKREDHKTSTVCASTGMTSAANHAARHQGPHKCIRINPSTNRPCNTIFSRPYDLTRHEDTIHNTTREKVRCEICNDDKTFSRQDALTRHKKVKHCMDK